MFYIVGAGYSILDILEEIWNIFKILVFGCKVGGCSGLERLHEVIF